MNSLFHLAYHVNNLETARHPSAIFWMWMIGLNRRHDIYHDLT